MTSTAVELPCANCGYDLRGLEDGACPECGAAFRAADLKPELHGLAIERRILEARSWRDAALIPLRIACAPRKAFQRECRLEHTLTENPLKPLAWLVLWYVMLVLCGIGITYTLDQLRGMERIFGYWHAGALPRFGPAILWPLELVLAWLGCVVIVCLGMLLSLRWVNPRQLLRLSLWLLPFALAGGVFTILYDAAWGLFLGNALSQLSDHTGWLIAYNAFHWAMDLRFRIHDLTLGLMAGIAVATVFKRNWWLIPPVTTIVLVLAFPLFARAHGAVRSDVYCPIVDAIYGPPPVYTGPPPLAFGPTFTAGQTAPALAGSWEVEYLDEDARMSAEVVIDDAGKVVLFRQINNESRKVSEFICDGQSHTVDSGSAEDEAVRMTYVVLSACTQTDSRVTVNVRIEIQVERQQGKTTEFIPLVWGEEFEGILADSGATISGKSHLRQETPVAQFEPDGVERPFVMRRSPAGSQPSTENKVP